MSDDASTDSRQRSEKRIAVRLPMSVRGRDRRGIPFEETTASENLCRGGAAFVVRYDIEPGSDLEITIPLARAGGPKETDFATRGRVVHVSEPSEGHERVVGVRFTGPRFQRVFRPETPY